QIDYARSMAFVAIDAAGELAGVVRLHSNADYRNGEYGLLLRSDLKGRGLGWKMMETIIDYARHEGLERIEDEGLCHNTTMLEMCGRLGFTIDHHPQDSKIGRARLKLR